DHAGGFAFGARAFLSSPAGRGRVRVRASLAQGCCGCSILGIRNGSFERVNADRDAIAGALLMTRAASPLLLFTTGLAGVLAGLLLGRGDPVVTAQAISAAKSAGRTEPASKPVGAEGLYAELDRQYAQFEQVNRTFELVARAVAPAVVHIVARKAA